MCNKMLISSESDLEKKLSNTGKPVMLMFYASWCGPCVMQLKINEEVSQEVDHFFIDIDNYPAPAIEKYEIKVIPTILFFKDRQEVKRIVGFQPLEKLKEEIRKILG